MKVVILEGIATSGKSSIATKLVEVLPLKTVRLVPESVTHMPIIDKTKRLHLDFFEDLIKKSLEEPADLVIFDRLYLSQALRAKATVSDYKKIEESLLPFSPLTVYLKVDEASLASRIKSAMKHRDPAWVEYVAARSQASGGAVAYYTNQQRHQVEILKQSKIPYIIYDTTDHNYQEIAEKIASQIT